MKYYLISRKKIVEDIYCTYNRVSTIILCNIDSETGKKNVAKNSVHVSRITVYLSQGLVVNAGAVTQPLVPLHQQNSQEKEEKSGKS